MQFWTPNNCLLRSPGFLPWNNWTKKISHLSNERRENAAFFTLTFVSTLNHQLNINSSDSQLNKRSHLPLVNSVQMSCSYRLLFLEKFYTSLFNFSILPIFLPHHAKKNHFLIDFKEKLNTQNTSALTLSYLPSQVRNYYYNRNYQLHILYRSLNLKSEGSANTKN